MKQFLRYIILLVSMTFALETKAQNQYPVVITPVVIPPVSPYLGQMLAQAGGRLSVMVRYVNSGTMAVRIVGHLERLSPAPFTIALNPSFIPRQPIILQGMQPMMLTNDLINQTFGNLTESNLVFDGITLSAIREGVNYKLPEGMYRLCFTAYTYDQSGQGRLASDPNMGCTTFNICYKAAAPQFTQPVNGMSVSSNITNVKPNSPMVFSWLPPAATCGAIPPGVNYDFEIRELLQGQTPTDAVNNPYVFQKKGLPSSTFVLDTNLYKQVLKPGKQYVMRVKANTNVAAAIAALEVDNQGYSRVEAFQYGDVPAKDTSKKDTNDDNGKSPELAANACSGVTPPSNTTPFAGTANDLLNQDVKIGEFTLHTGKIEKKGNGYSGSGYVTWSPFVTTLQLKVNFDSIKINTDKQVYEGLVITSTEPQQFSWGPLANAQDLLKATGMADNKTVADLNQYLNSGAKFLDQVAGNTPIDMPLGWTHNIDGTPVTVAIMGISFSPKGTNMNLLTSVNIPEANGWLSLAGTNFCVRPAGLSISDGTLYLPNDRDVNLFSGGDAMNFKFKGSSSADTTKGTYVNLKNGKLQRFVARAELSLPQNAVLPEDDKGNIKDGSVVAALTFDFASWEDWMASVTIPAFQVKGLKGLSFKPGTVFYDHSAQRNATGFKYPQVAGTQPGNEFEGLYIKELQVLLPPDFKTFNSGDARTAFAATGFIIDDKGISADISAQHVIDLSTGNLGGWAFSLDSIGVQIVRNTFKAGAMNGKFLLPVSSTHLQYTGDLHVGNGDSLQYEFVINPEDKMQFDIWKAQVTLSKNSAFRVKRDEHGAAVSVVLSGGISLNISDEPAINLGLMQFDSLGLANRDMKTNAEKFWISPGHWSFGSNSGNKSAFNRFNTDAGTPLYALRGPNAGEDYAGDGDDGQSKLSGFPISLTNIGPLLDVSDMSHLKVGIKFSVKVGLGFGDNSVLAATAGVGIYGELNAAITNMAPKLTATAKVELDTLKVNGNVGPVKIDGSLFFYHHDATYGDGFKGQVAADFKLAKLDATAQFGKVNGYNYWYVDGNATFAAVMPLVTVIGLNGFGGGAYYNMKMQNQLPTDIGTPKSASNSTQPGTTPSGITFVPAQGGFGLRASVMVALVDPAGPKTMNGKVTLTAEMLNGAFSAIALSGKVFIVTDPPGNNNAIVKGAVDMSYNAVTEEFNFVGDINCNFASVQVDIPFGIHDGHDGWFLKVGDPAGKRASFTLLRAEQKGLYKAVVTGEAYLAMGSLIDPYLPDLPAIITSHHLQRDPSADAMLDLIRNVPGSGFMMGAYVSGDLRFQLAFMYASATAVLGFDLALKQFDSTFTCGGQSAGWNNWYAMGQLYAYLGVEVGLSLDTWFYSGDITILRADVGALLTGGLPNPTWMEGKLTVQANVLGLFEIDEEPHFTIGDKCYPAYNPFGDIKMISDCGPGGKGNTWDYPYVVSNIGFDKDYSIVVPPSDKFPQGDTRTIRFYVGKFTLRNHKTGQTVEVAGPQFNTAKDAAKLVPLKLLDPKTTYDVDISLYAKQFYTNTNRWDDPLNASGQPGAVSQDTSFSFTTGLSPTSVIEDRIHAMYPVKYQRYVLKNEHSAMGKISMQQWQDNIFPTDKNGLLSTVDYKVYFITVPGNDTLRADFSMSNGGKDLDFPLPAGLKNNTVYRTEFWCLHKNLNQAIKNVFSTTTSFDTRTIAGVQTTFRNTKMSNAGTPQELPHPVYTLYFRTSQYNNFADKLQTYGNWNASRHGNDYSINSSGFGVERFDELEVNGYKAPDGTPFPPMLQTDIPWNAALQNDKFSEDNIYANKFLLGVYRVFMDLGNAAVREGSGKPVYTTGMGSFNSDPQLDPIESGEVSAIAAVQQKGLGKIGSGSFATSVTVPASSNSLVTTRSSGAILQLPVTAKLNTSALVTSGGLAGMSQIAAAANSSFSVGLTGISTIVWYRDYYIQQDFNLMKQVGANFTNNYVYVSQNLPPAKAENILAGWDSDMWLGDNGTGGTASIPWSSFYKAMTNYTVMSKINYMRNMTWQSMPKGTRTLVFRYLGNTVNKTFNY
ncbi:hypothetical protein [Chitinophaga sp. Cy-1792]|uniref:hypothetical protein n=1 Tax=Chitinophaga sp. Cy-1792 TaxID=2608339 RepID=UPI00141EAA8F|nr:hypothetical protein [Chitinophaga sp. Cy-1792]NIG56418.1 hypothetical protein [Chitinophaga sp. Cy-1792]